MYQGKCVILGVTGGIAAYKALDVASGLRKKGIIIETVMTENATKFVTPLTFRSITNNPVSVDTFAEPKIWDIQHISLANKADLILVCPATANIVGKVANGIADDLLTTTIMATKAQVVFALAMNTNMYENPIFQSNVEKLRKLGYGFIEPVEGILACGASGKGRLAPVEQIIAETLIYLHRPKDLTNKRVLITAGATREAIDPVRYITNHSTGKMGYALAEMAKRRGADVILISGPTNLVPPPGVTVVKIKSAREMAEEVFRYFDQVDIVIKSAAVADYRPAVAVSHKIKKKDEDLIIELSRNPDILYELGKRKDKQVLVGFAAETDNLLANAQEKIKKKNLDFIVANDVLVPGAGFGYDTNIVKMITPDGSIEEYPLMSKEEVANKVLDKALKIYNSRYLE
ncbi:MAG TPA: bifunctional phosphopantothenoylcysteine decarboxylase/phosphopantothenate--cysteine ligase CoaBC [Clostridia bacterium]|nr:bifunctional phosphopantothenoylcysteine decarboxylase/phosphopantothenate--cysteine ligase CoaBC [Clostridia bacterium]